MLRKPGPGVRRTDSGTRVPAARTREAVLPRGRAGLTRYQFSQPARPHGAGLGPRIFQAGGMGQMFAAVTFRRSRHVADPCDFTDEELPGC
jgi:hypothetical protein